MFKTYLKHQSSNSWTFFDSNNASRAELLRQESIASKNGKQSSLTVVLPTTLKQKMTTQEDDYIKLLAREKKILSLKSALLRTYEIQAIEKENIHSSIGQDLLGEADYARNRQNMERLSSVLGLISTSSSILTGTLLDEFKQELSACHGDFHAFRIQLANQIKECTEKEHAMLMKSLASASTEGEEYPRLALFNKDNTFWDSAAMEMVNVVPEDGKALYPHTISVLKHLLQVTHARLDSEKHNEAVHHQLQCLLEQVIQTLDMGHAMDRGQWQCLIVSIMGSIVWLYNPYGVEKNEEREKKYKFLCVRKKYQTLHSEMDLANEEDYPKLYCQGLHFCVNYL